MVDNTLRDLFTSEVKCDSSVLDANPFYLKKRCYIFLGNICC